MDDPGREPTSRRGRAIIPIVGLSILVGSTASRVGAETYQPPDCGLKALYQMLRLRDRPSGLAEIEGALPRRDAAGYSMAELRDAARECGIRLRGVRFTGADVPLDRPAIALLDRGESGHFVVLRPVGVTGTMVQVLEPPHPPRVMDYSALLASRQWTGALLVPESNGEWLARWAPFALVAMAPALLIAWLLRRRARPPDRTGMRAYQGCSIMPTIWVTILSITLWKPSWVVSPSSG